MNQKLVVKKKEDPEKKITRTHKLLDACKLHDGPVTMSTLDLLSMNKKHKPNETDQRWQEKPQPKIFTDEELHTSIRNAIKPETNIEEDLDILKP